ncbi:MAG TPA: hypothetical protein VIV15_17710 [Anaerolineales bacterium]
MSFSVASIGAPDGLKSPVNTTGQTPLAGRNDQFTRLILLERLDLPTLLIALIISVVWGAMHALTPGHGKTIVGAYLVGSRGTPRHALYLGLTTTVTHTLGVFVLGLITLFASRFIVPEALYPWMSLLSGLFVVAIGVNLAISRFRSSRRSQARDSANQVPGKTSAISLAGVSRIEKFHIDGNLRWQMDSAGLLPSHAHPHSYDHSHDHGHLHSHVHPHADGPAHHHGEHSHLPPGADGSPVTWRSLLLLGISGGILPCPSALVVLLGAIALGRIGFGLVLVLAFSAGLAGALTAIGLTFIYAGRVFEKIPMRGRLIGMLPGLSALFIAGIGVVIMLRALEQMGLLA